MAGWPFGYEEERDRRIREEWAARDAERERAVEPSGWIKPGLKPKSAVRPKVQPMRVKRTYERITIERTIIEYDLE